MLKTSGQVENPTYEKERGHRQLRECSKPTVATTSPNPNSDNRLSRGAIAFFRSACGHVAMTASQPGFRPHLGQGRNRSNANDRSRLVMPVGLFSKGDSWGYTFSGPRL